MLILKQAKLCFFRYDDKGRLLIINNGNSISYIRDYKKALYNFWSKKSLGDDVIWVYGTDLEFSFPIPHFNSKDLISLMYMHQCIISNKDYYILSKCSTCSEQFMRKWYYQKHNLKL